MTKGRFVVETRTLPVLPQGRDRALVEEVLRKTSKKDVSVSHVGDVTACADQRGTNVLIAPRAEGAELRVAVQVRAHMSDSIALGLFLSAITCSLLLVLAAKTVLWVPIATLIVVMSALVFGVGRLSRFRTRRRARRTADAIVAALPRARVELDVDDDEANDANEADEIAPDDARRRARA